MRIRIPFIIVVGTGADHRRRIHAQITDPIPAPVEKRGLMVEIRDVVRLPDTRGMRPLDQDVNPAGWARVQLRARPARRPPVRQRLARASCTCSTANNQPSVYANVARGVPARDLQPAGERLHRLRLPSGVREERPLLHGARRARDGQPRDAQLHPARVHGRRTSPITT